MKSKKLENFFNKKKILITGHSGFTGSWMTFILDSFGAKIFGLSLNEKNKNAAYNALNIKKKLKGEALFDIRNVKKTSNFIKKINPEIIFHLAAQPLVSEAYKNTSYTFETNVIGTINLLDSCKNLKNIKSIIVITSDKCYKNNPNNRKYFIESDPIGANDPYSTSKAAQELIVDTYRDYIFKKKNLFISTARAGNIIGGGDVSLNRIVPDYFKSFYSKKRLKIRNAHSTRPWQFILDVVFGYLILAVKHKKSTQGAWNFGPDINNIKVKDFITILNNLNKNQVKIISKKNHIKESKYLALNSEKSKKILGWKPKYNINKMLSLTSEWYRSLNNYKNLNIISKKQIKDYLKKLD